MGGDIQQRQRQITMNPGLKRHLNLEVDIEPEGDRITAALLLLLLRLLLLLLLHRSLHLLLLLPPLRSLLPFPLFPLLPPLRPSNLLLPARRAVHLVVGGLSRLPLLRLRLRRLGGLLAVGHGGRRALGRRRARGRRRPRCVLG